MKYMVGYKAIRTLLFFVLSLLPAVLVHGDFPDFLKDELLDKVIGLSNHPLDENGNYPSGLAETLNEISKLQFEGQSKAILRARVSDLCQNPVFLRWCEDRLQLLWQAKDKEIESLETNQQSLQSTINQIEVELAKLRKEKGSSGDRSSRLESANKELREKLQKSSPGGGDDPSFPYMEVLSGVLGLLL
ncbi:uncharacterized protein METZ01_LOCUS325084, partial [marine metagenome]